MESQQSQRSGSPVGTHPVLVCADAVEAALQDVAGVDPGFMRTGEKAEALRRLSRLEGRLAGLRMRVMASAGEVAEATADHSVATWLATETRTEVRDRYGELALARRMERRWTRLGAAVTQGSVNLAQARVIAHALADLPEAEVGAEVLVRAEEALVGYAATYAPRPLRWLGRRILEVAAPEACDRAEGRALERQERRTAAVTSLTLRSCGDGTTRITGRLADAVADWLRTYLDAYASPRHRAVVHREPEEPASPRKRWGQAFGAFLEAADPARMPEHGGDATTVLVTIDLNTWPRIWRGSGWSGRSRSAPARCGGWRAPPEFGVPARASSGLDFETRRSVPRKLGPEPTLLNPSLHLLPRELGSSARAGFRDASLGPSQARPRADAPQSLASSAPSRAREQRSGCEAHHAKTPWAQGGLTDIADGALLCAWHHHRAHDHRYHTRRLPDGDYRFHRRT